VVVMNHGRIEQIGTPGDVYDHPATPFVYEFLGHVNRWPQSADAGGGYARPHEISVAREAEANALPARLLHSAAVGPMSRLEFVLLAGEQTINVELPRERARSLALAVGEVAYLQALRVRAFEDTTSD